MILSLACGRAPPQRPIGLGADLGIRNWWHHLISGDNRFRRICRRAHFVELTGVPCGVLLNIWPTLHSMTMAVWFWTRRG